MPESSVVRKMWGELTPEEVYAVAKLRTDVFFVEQHVDETELDYRDLEPTTEHFWIADAVGTAAYLRVLEDPQPSFRDARHLIGRVVVRADRRGEGLAQLLIAEVLATYGDRPMVLHAQQYIAPLYAKYGFETHGEPYVEAGIPHLLMYRAANPE